MSKAMKFIEQLPASRVMKFDFEWARNGFAHLIYGNMPKHPKHIGLPGNYYEYRENWESQIGWF